MWEKISEKKSTDFLEKCDTEKKKVPPQNGHLEKKKTLTNPNLHNKTVLTRYYSIAVTILSDY